ncbi:hypothetical protein [Rivibacter subsaxonicus]|uniref:DUF4175 domain-containing protein n=1 Tax=Rivibacter subsaxonicus TaxID=457575 RepID=A0A4Q7VZP3_9BURK|nr:hypothetical protein [Rivibacter subsaxonicus]RZU02327.1 hypothetical protein EV670_0350 [Rivibacter subsaxonicus]
MKRLWFWPALVAVVTAAGLLAGLVSDGLGDLIAWLCLALPLALIAWHISRGRPSTSNRSSISLQRELP